MTEKRELTKPSGNALQIYAKDKAEAQRQIAQTLTSPSVNAALVISASAPQIVEAKDGLMDFGALVDELTRVTEALGGGDMGRVEAMLASQAHALQALFASRAPYDHGLLLRPLPDLWTARAQGAESMPGNTGDLGRAQASQTSHVH